MSNQIKDISVADKSSQYCVYESGLIYAKFLFCVFHRFVNYMIRCLFHERDLIKAYPEDISYIILYASFYQFGDNMVKKTFPTNYP
jgi:Na+-translocating ferredoxin:NAD+ oxidoreductase RnfA subunit